MEEKKKRVKDRIVSAAWELFYEKGYDATTVDDIIRLSRPRDPFTIILMGRTLC